MDTSKASPLKTMTVYFLINQSKLKDTSFVSVGNFINIDSVIQKHIRKNYSVFTAIFLKQSENTDRLLKIKTQKMLTLCAGDVIAEYVWLNGKLSDTIYYENGIIKGTENIQLQDLRK